jgi:hypothetical protein
MNALRPARPNASPADSFREHYIPPEFGARLGGGCGGGGGGLQSAVVATGAALPGSRRPVFPSGWEPSMSRSDLWAKVSIWAALILGIGLLGVVDYLTGREFNFFVFYFIPVSWAAYRLGFVPAITSALLSEISWTLADSLAGAPDIHPIFVVWNALARLTAFLAIGWTVAKMSVLLRHERENSEQLRITLAELKVLEGFLPICAYCKKIREDDGTWRQMETYITEHSGAKFSHGLCPECGKKLLAEAGLAENDPTPPNPTPGTSNPGAAPR